MTRPFPSAFPDRAAAMREAVTAEMLTRLADKLASAERLARQIATRSDDAADDMTRLADDIAASAHDCSVAHHARVAAERVAVFDEEMAL